VAVLQQQLQLGCVLLAALVLLLLVLQPVPALETWCCCKASCCSCGHPCSSWGGSTGESQLIQTHNGTATFSASLSSRASCACEWLMYTLYLSKVNDPDSSQQYHEHACHGPVLPGVPTGVAC